MAKVRGTVINASVDGGGFTSGLVGDYPIDEAMRIVLEGRLRTDDVPDMISRVEANAVTSLLVGLGVGSLSELAKLVELGRCVEGSVEGSLLLIPPPSES